ncbi:MAG: GNAT family N-acetyltransferase [Geminicoccaceae bacterium]
MSKLASGFHIRPVGVADLDAIALLQERSIMAFGAPVYGEAKAKAWARLGFEFRHDLLGAGGFWVAERDDRILGVGGWSPDSLEPDVAWLRYLFVQPQAAGQGIGRRLVEEAERSAGAAHRPRLHVWSSMNAVGFYRTVGYRVRRRARWPIQAGIELDYMLMTKRLERRPAAVTVASPAQTRVP